MLTTAPPPPPPPPPPHPTINTSHQLPPFHLHPQNPPPPPPPTLFPFSTQNHHTHFLNPWDPPQSPNPNPNNLQHQNPLHIMKYESVHLPPPPISSSPFFQPPPPPPLKNVTSPSLSATALLQKAVNIGAHPIGRVASTMTSLDAFTGAGMSPEYMGFTPGNISSWQKSDRLTRDFLGLTRDQCDGGGGSGDARNMLSFTPGVEYHTAYERESHSLVKAQQGYGFAEPPPPPPPPPPPSETWG